MRAKYFVGAVTAIGLLAVATVANAATISIGARVDGIGAITTLAGPTVGHATFDGPVGGIYAVSADGTGQPVLPAGGVLASNNLSIAGLGSGSHFIDVYITSQGNTLTGVLDFVSSFTLNSILG